jgi:hypothetical protein
MPATTQTPTIDFVGKSGNKYVFSIHALNTTFNAVGGVYVFTKATQTAAGGQTHKVIYVGQTGDLSSRFTDHHKQVCINGNGANSICVRGEADEATRLAIEKDLVDAYNPPCNG